MMLILSIVFALISLLGIGYTLISGGGLTVDNLFLILILLTMAGIFLLNVLLEARQRGWLRRKKVEAPAAATNQKQAAQAAPKTS